MRFHKTKIFAIIAGIRTSAAIGPHWAAPLHPSVRQVSQNSVLMQDGVVAE